MKFNSFILNSISSLLVGKNNLSTTFIENKYVYCFKHNVPNTANCMLVASTFSMLLQVLCL